MHSRLCSRELFYICEMTAINLLGGHAGRKERVAADRDITDQPGPLQYLDGPRQVSQWFGHRRRNFRITLLYLM
jgi:hypothetical protein